VRKEAFAARQVRIGHDRELHCKQSALRVPVGG
jgi:hypothetical protein